MAIFNSYVELPEGIFFWIQGMYLEHAGTIPKMSQQSPAPAARFWLELSGRLARRDVVRPSSLPWHGNIIGYDQGDIIHRNWYLKGFYLRYHVAHPRINPELWMVCYWVYLIHRYSIKDLVNKYIHISFIHIYIYTYIYEWRNMKKHM